jgi:hypothetical protein
MAHFAEIDSERIVQRVIVVNNEDCIDENGQESEAVGALFCHNLLGGVWKQTSYNAKIRKNYAGNGYTYDEDRDAFIPPKPFDSWILDEETCLWNPPVPMPSEGIWNWNEDIINWEEVSE